MKRRNVVGSSVGYVERVCDSYSNVDIKQVSVHLLIVPGICLEKKAYKHFLIFQIRKYFLSVLKFMTLYKSGETGDTVFKLMAMQRKKHREGVVFGPVDHSKRSMTERGTFLCK